MKKFFLIALVAVVVIGATALPVYAALETGTAGVFKGALGFLADLGTSTLGVILLPVAVVAWLALWLMYSVVLMLIWLLIWVASYNGFGNSPTIIIGWIVVRDLANMFFVIVLLTIAIATILRIERYEWKQHLPRLLLMAVFINFSKTISLLLVDISQVITLTFVSTFRGAAGSFVDAFGLTNLFELVQSTPSLSWLRTALLEFNVTIILGAIFMFIVSIVLGAMVVVFAGRIIMLWLLIVLSPLAYFASTFPQGEKYHEQWWEEFTKNLIVGPALAFFVWLGLQVLATLNQGAVRGFFGDPSALQGLPEPTQFGISKLGTGDNILKFVIATGMFFGGLEMAQKLATIGGQVAAGAVKLIEEGAKVPFEFVAREYAERVAESDIHPVLKGILNPIAAARGLAEHWKQREEEVKGTATAGGREAIDFIRTGGKLRLPRVETQRAQEEDKFSKDYARMNKEQKAEALKSMWSMGGVEGEIRRASLLKAMAAEGHLDDALAIDFFKNEARWVDEHGVEREGFIDKQTGAVYNQEILRNFLAAGLGHNRDMRHQVQNGLRVMHDIGEIGKKAGGHYEYEGMERFNNATGKWELNTVEGAAEDAEAELNKLAQRAQRQAAPHVMNALYQKRNAQGEFIGGMYWGKGGAFEEANRRRILATATDQDVNEVERYTQFRTVNTAGIFDQSDSEHPMYNFDLLENAADKQALVDHVRAQYEEPTGYRTLAALFRKSRAEKIMLGGQEYQDFDDLAMRSGWRRTTTLGDASKLAGSADQKNLIDQRAAQIKQDREARGASYSDIDAAVPSFTPASETRYLQRDREVAREQVAREIFSRGVGESVMGVATSEALTNAIRDTLGSIMEQGADYGAASQRLQAAGIPPEQLTRILDQLASAMMHQRVEQLNLAPTLTTAGLSGELARRLGPVIRLGMGAASRENFMQQRTGAPAALRVTVEVSNRIRQAREEGKIQLDDAAIQRIADAVGQLPL